MTEATSPEPNTNRSETDHSSRSSGGGRLLSSRSLLLAGVILCIVAVDPALAQTAGEEFCDTDMAETVKNLFSLIQFGGPLIGAVVALGTTVAMTAVRRADLKKELKEARNQAVVWGIIVAPLGTAIVGFLLNNVVEGASSCGL